MSEMEICFSADNIEIIERTYTSLSPDMPSNGRRDSSFDRFTCPFQDPKMLTTSDLMHTGFPYISRIAAGALEVINMV